MLPEEHAGLPDLEAEFAVDGSLLGRGANGTVHRAACRQTGRRVAVKRFAAKMRRPEALAAFRRECRIHRAMQHPHIVKAEGVYSSGETVHMVMEHLEGGELFGRISETDYGMPEIEVAMVTMQLLRAVGHLHAHGIVHRDLKPENVVFSEKGGTDVKLIDMGLAVELRQGERLRRVCGTIQYSAPEVLQHVGYDERVDMWSLGAIVYESLVARRLYSSRDLLEVGRQARLGQVDYCRAFKGVSRSAQHFVRRLLAVNPKERPSAIEALRDPWLCRLLPEEAEASYQELAATYAALQVKLPCSVASMRGHREKAEGCFSFLQPSRSDQPVWSCLGLLTR